MKFDRTQGGSGMKNIFAAIFLFCLLLFLLACSSNSGTDSIGDIQNHAASRLGQSVVVVGMAETKTPMSGFKMFKLYDGSKFIWVLRDPSTEEPPQGYRIRVSGKLQQNEFNVIGKVYYIEANKISME
jgi:hypothetical protein